MSRHLIPVCVLLACVVAACDLASHEEPRSGLAPQTNQAAPLAVPVSAPFVYQAQRYKQFDNVYAAMLMIGLIGLFTDQILALLGRFLFPSEKGGRSLKSLFKPRAEDATPPVLGGAA